MPKAPNVARAPGTPAEVETQDEPRAPVTDPALGIAVPPSKATGKPRNRLVAIGDSLTHGFQSGAVFNTAWSYPTMIARALGCFESFRYPTYNGFGGVPINIEYLLREMEEQFGNRVDWHEAPLALFRIRHVMDKIEDWWERGGGGDPELRTGVMHNLGIYGWDLRDTLSRTAETERARMVEPRDNLLKQIVENANEIAAVRVLDSARDAAAKRALTPLQAAAALGEEGVEGAGAGGAKGEGIETLIVFLGANNALSAVTQLRVAWSGDGYDDVDRKRGFTVWRPSHFAAEFDEVVAEVKKIKARHVIFTTVPHVTIAPIARGVGTKVRPGSRYFPYYTRPWIGDRDFDVGRDPSITEAQARDVDSAIDMYNDHIVERVGEARKEKRDWYVLDIAGLLDRMASRRYILDPAARPDWWTPYELPPELQALRPVPDSRFFATDANGRVAGGLFSLDGVHPTTIAYGLVAQEFCSIMHMAGVAFPGATPTKPPRIDFDRLITHDTLIAKPPVSLTPDLRMMGWLDETVDIARRLLWH